MKRQDGKADVCDHTLSHLFDTLLVAGLTRSQHKWQTDCQIWSEAAQPLELMAFAGYDVAPCARHIKHRKVICISGDGTPGALDPRVQAGVLIKQGILISEASAAGSSAWSLSKATSRQL